MMELVSILLVICVLGVIVSRKLILTLLYLIGSFIVSSLMLVGLKLDFMGLLLIIVYVGAVAVLFLFVIMMLEEVDREEEKGKNYLLVVLPIVILNIYLKDTLREDSIMEWKTLVDNEDNIRIIGELLYVENMVDILLIGILLLVGILGGVILALKD